MYMNTYTNIYIYYVTCKILYIEMKVNASTLHIHYYFSPGFFISHVLILFSHQSVFPYEIIILNNNTNTP
jgi:hypothetical protein